LFLCYKLKCIAPTKTTGYRRTSTIKQTSNSDSLVRSAIPRYLQLASLFRRRIETGSWAVGAQIPTVEDLSAECGVARATIRQALGLLEDEGLVSRFRAKGTYVNKRPQDLLWLHVETDWNGLLTKREGARIEILEEETNVTPPMPPHTGTLVGEYRHLRRLHWRDDSPFLVADVYIEESLAKQINKKAFSTTTALQLIADVPGVKIKDARQTLTIGSADIETAKLLMMELNAPIAKVGRSVVNNEGQIVLISNGIYRGDIVRVDLEMRP
jgi:GntR family transcriptional regulator